MKIVVSGYVGKKITGIGRNLICLLDFADDSNKYVIYTNYDMKDAFHFNNKNVKVKTYNISKNSSMGNLLWTTFVFPFKVLQEKADKALIPNFTLLLFKFKPTVVIMHDLIEFNVPDKFSKQKMFYRTKIADPITANRANRIITVSNNSKSDLMRFLKVPEEKISVVYNGVDQDKFFKMDKIAAEKILVNRQWPMNFILYAGTIDHPGKNAMGLIKAYEILKRNGKYTGNLILAGMPGSGYEIVKDYANRSEFARDIIFTGFVTDEELVALYSTCKIFCFLSLYEGFGIPPLEALSCGARVVVANTSSLPEVVGNVGEKVDPNSIDSVLKGIEKALSVRDELYEEKVGRHLDNFHWDELSKKFEGALNAK